MSRPLPQPTPETQSYWDAAREGRLLIQRCKGCGKHQFYPRAFCVRCLSEDVDFVQARGEGTIYTYTINHRAANEAMQTSLPYAVAVVELAEGVRLMANIVESDLAAIRIGAAVEVNFERVGESISLPQFRLK